LIVLDTSALLAFLLGEKGQQRVATELSRSVMSTINLSETLARMIPHGIDPRALRVQLDTAGIRFVDLDAAQAVVVAEIRDRMRRRGIGIADCCCLALGLHIAVPVLTADRAWSQLGLGVQVDLIR
jgi:ribonuclease VapC